VIVALLYAVCCLLLAVCLSAVLGSAVDGQRMAENPNIMEDDVDEVGCCMLLLWAVLVWC
jgi:hypothetical protein